MAKRALIIGGSVGGLLAGLHLRQIGWDVMVYERSTGELADRGAGIGTQPQLYEVMASLGVKFEAGDGVAQNRRQCLSPSGDVIARIEMHSIASAWDRVYRPLRAAFPDEFYAQGRRVVSIEQDAHSVTAVFADGVRETGDLLIACDGGQSTVRGMLAPDVAPKYAGYAAWRGVIEESELSRDEHELMFGAQNFCFPFGELALGIGVSGRAQGSQAGEQRFYWIWYRVADVKSGLRDLFTDATGHHHGMQIPPHLVRDDVLAELRAHAPKSLAPQLASVVLKTKRPFPSAIFDLEQDRLVFGRVALLGDSAFIARPHVASGLTKAAMDARMLAICLREERDIFEALARYEISRVENGRKVVERARYIGRHLEAVARGDKDPPIYEPLETITGYGSAGLMT